MQSLVCDTERACSSRAAPQLLRDASGHGNYRLSGFDLREVRYEAAGGAAVASVADAAADGVTAARLS
jgi:hypothetical protein